MTCVGTDIATLMFTARRKSRITSKWNIWTGEDLEQVTEDDLKQRTGDDLEQRTRDDLEQRTRDALEQSQYCCPCISFLLPYNYIIGANSSIKNMSNY